MALSQLFNNLWGKVKQSPTFVPTYIEFTPQQTDEPQLYSETFDDRKHYFMISVSEMFLSYQRLWHQNFSPMVFSVCNFKYNGSTLEIPYVIGPSLLKKFEQRLPKGMLFLNTPVVGMHPWRGGNVSYSIILCRVKETNNAEKLLNVIEDVSNSLDFGTGLANYTKIGKVVLNGFDSLLGFQQTSPLLGLNNNFGQAAGNQFKPGFHALIRATDLDKNKFWIKNNTLCYGDSLKTSEPYREDDFVLFRIGISDARKDEETLAFYNEYNEIYDDIQHQSEITSEYRDRLRAKMLHLAVSIRRSPDLTDLQADRIWEEKCEEINKFVDRLAKLDGAASTTTKTWNASDKIMNSALRDLKF